MDWRPFVESLKKDFDARMETLTPFEMSPAERILSGWSTCPCSHCSGRGWIYAKRGDNGSDNHSTRT